jgi:hypothetical protein
MEYALRGNPDGAVVVSFNLVSICELILAANLGAKTANLGANLGVNLGFSVPVSL